MLRVLERQMKVPRDCCGRSATLLLALCIALVLFAGESAVAQISSLSKATTSRAAKEDAIRGIPFRNLSAPAQQRIAAVIKKPTMFRRMPITAIQCDPEMHRFSIRNPEVIVGIWQLMGITQVTAQRTAPYILKCNDGVGTVTDMELIYGDNDTHIIFCEGSYDGPLFRKPLTGRCVLVLRSGAVPVASGGYQITNMLDVFVQVDHAGLDIFAKTLHPLLGKSADINFVESMKFVARMSNAAEKNGDGMQHMAGRLQGVEPTVRTQFEQVIGNVYRRHVQAMAKSGSLPTATSSRPMATRTR